jgi:hypothetical protein
VLWNLPLRLRHLGKREVPTLSASFYLTVVVTNVSAGVSCSVTNVLQ